MTQDTRQRSKYMPGRFQSDTDELPETRKRRDILVVLGIALVVLTGLLWGEMDEPPLWDALWSTSAGAAELSRNGFDYFELIQQPGFRDGGPGSHAPSLVTPVLGIFFVLFGSEGGLIAGHVLFLVLGAGLAAATFILATRFLERRLAFMVAGATILFPVVLQQIADPYLELPLALLVVLAVNATLDGNRRSTALFSALAVWVKPTGLILLPVIALMGVKRERGRWYKNGLTGLVAVLPFWIQMTAPSITTQATGLESTWEGTWILLRSAIISLFITTDVFLLLGLVLLAFVQYRDANRDFVNLIGLLTLGFAGIMGYTLVVSQGITVLPRYYVVLIPLWLIVVTLRFQSQSSKLAVSFLGVLIAFSLVNFDGRFYPAADHRQPWVAERSVGAASEYRDLMVLGTRSLAAEPVDALIGGRAIQFRFMYPELGFVDEQPDNFILIHSLPDELPQTFAWLEEPHSEMNDAALERIAIDGGWSLRRQTVYSGRWESEVVVASKD